MRFYRMNSEITVYETFAESAQKIPNQKIIFPDENKEFTYTTFKEFVDEIAESITAMGAKYDDHLAICGLNCSLWLGSLYACSKLGVVAVPVISRLSNAEMLHVLNTAQCKYLFDFGAIKKDFEIKTDYLEMVVTLGDFAPYKKAMNFETFFASKAKVDGAHYNRLYSIQFTSGTTSASKGAMEKQDGILKTSYCFNEALMLNSDDVFLLQLPLYYCYGNVLIATTFHKFGAALIVPQKITVDVCVELVAKYHCTVTGGVPELLYGMATSELVKTLDVSSLKKIVFGGSFCPERHALKITESFNTNQLTVAYGLTEGATLTCVARLADKTMTMNQRINSIGKAIDCIETRVVDLSTGKVLGDDEQGELQVKSDVIMMGYYHDKENTDKTITPDGWLHTGDLVTRSSDGLYHMRGRCKDIIIRNGENISAAQIENRLTSFKAIKNAQVIGVSDEHLGETVAAVVILKDDSTLPDINELNQFLYEEIAKFKTPEYYIKATSYPLNASGKILKRVLRENAEKNRSKLQKGVWNVID